MGFWYAESNQRGVHRSIFHTRAGKGTPYQINVYGNQHVRSTLP